MPPRQAYYGNPNDEAKDNVLADTLRRDLQARSELVRELLASLDGPADRDAAFAWATEIKRRVADLELGSAELESWDHTKHTIEHNVLGR